ncbi:MAG TPA: biotin-dependent carboxyltransferase family protein [Rhodanobacteraceae bacterium]|nr:biotin-dependent carboxyltransferase family protein [Rhodanobacteraceae bacterium]
MNLHVLKPGLQTTVQDGGRRGHAALGVGASGAMDDIALRLANALVGNPPGAAALEMTLIGPELRLDRDAVIALTGAELDAHAAGPRREPMALPMWRPLHLAAGSVLVCGRLHAGARSYLAVAGGFAVDPVLGSESTDINAGLGPFDGRALAAGDVVAIDGAGRPRGPGKPTGSAAAEAPSQAWSLDPRPWSYPDTARPVRLIRGSHFDALDEASRQRLFGAGFRIAAESNRVGLRLEGPPLALSAPLELVSEPVAAGTVQLPPGGQPIVLMAEHPTTGGYPRIGQVAAIDLPRLGQRRPGDPLRFVPIGIDEAQTRYLARERELARLVEIVRERLAQ